MTGEDGRGSGEAAKSYDRKKAWSSINHPIFSGWHVERFIGTRLCLNELEFLSSRKGTFRRKLQEVIPNIDLFRGDFWWGLYSTLLYLRPPTTVIGEFVWGDLKILYLTMLYLRPLIVSLRLWHWQ
jgi:hypothetical protein